MNLKIWLNYLGSLFERITSTTKCIRYKRYTRHKYFHLGNHKGENPANFFRIVRCSKAVIRNVQQLSFSPPMTVSLSQNSLESVWGVYKWGREPPYLYPFNSLTKYKTRAYMSSHMGPTSPRDTIITYYIMLHWGLFPRLTMEVVPQGLETIYTSCKGATHIPNGGTTTYNDNIHQNIFQSYKYIKNPS